MAFLSSKVFAVFITFLAFYGAQRIYLRFRRFWLNPVLLSIVSLIAFLKATGLPYPTYFEGGRIISFFLGPSVVALGVPLYLQLEEIRKRGRAIGVSMAVASVVGVGSAAGTAALLGASDPVIFSMAPKSVTTPIAMGISEKIGGIPSLTAAIVIATGVLGAVIGPGVLRLCRIRSRVAFGLAMGAASHGIGTARAVEEGEVEGASGGLAICLNGIATAVVTPVLVKLLLMLVRP
ncbi:MAG: LrgB family protein [Desulfacinum sp.]|jgi:predicted murein hydrolase (TIGR00659 family)|nr:LrgB family protein [Desulfacinum sp.]